MLLFKSRGRIIIQYARNNENNNSQITARRTLNSNDATVIARTITAS